MEDLVSEHPRRLAPEPATPPGDHDDVAAGVRHAQLQRRGALHHHDRLSAHELTRGAADRVDRAAPEPALRPRPVLGRRSRRATVLLQRPDLAGVQVVGAQSTDEVILRLQGRARLGRIHQPNGHAGALPRAPTPMPIRGVRAAAQHQRQRQPPHRLRHQRTAQATAVISASHGAHATVASEPMQPSSKRPRWNGASRK